MGFFSDHRRYFSFPLSDRNTCRRLVNRCTMNKMPFPLNDDELPALDRDAPKAQDVIDEWLDRAVDAMDAWRSANTSETAYDLLAAWAGLNRLRANLLPELNTIKEDIGQMVTSDQKALAQLAAMVPSPQGWIEEANEWKESIDRDLPEAFVIAERAWELFSDLDDAQLVACAIGRINGQADELHDRLVPCMIWFLDNADLFVLISAYIRASIEALQPDFYEKHPELSTTLIKHSAIIDATIELKLMIEANNAPAWPRETVERWLTEIRHEHGRS